jgi:hypothetical protein
MSMIMNLKDLREIVSLSGLETEPKLPNKPTSLRITSRNGETYKVRKYLTASDALQQEKLLAAGNGLFAKCYGRSENYLVLEFFKTDSQPHHSTEHLAELGEFLGALAELKVEAVIPDDFDLWIKDLAASCIFQTSTLRLLRRYYRDHVELAGVAWGLEYFDAMPRNFVLKGRSLVSIDEKHLRIGPKGVSLIKPMWELTERDFRCLLGRYQTRVASNRFEDLGYRQFISFYYLVYGLAFVGSHKSRGINIQIPEFHQRRGELLRIVHASWVTRLREQVFWLPFYVFYRAWAHVKAALLALANRVLGLLRLRPRAEVNT